MKTLPQSVSAYKRTPRFDEHSVPKGLLKSHRTKDNVWAKIVILDGHLRYSINEPETEVVTLSKEQYGIVEPKIPHAVQPMGSVRFYVEFFR